MPSPVLPYDIVFCSSHDPHHPVSRVVGCNAASLAHENTTVGWVSARNAKPPQSLVLRFAGNVLLSELCILSHESKTASSVEVRAYRVDDEATNATATTAAAGHVRNTTPTSLLTAGGGGAMTPMSAARTSAQQQQQSPPQQQPQQPQLPPSSSTPSHAVAAPSFKAVRFTRLGSVDFSSQEASHWRARERKTVHMRTEAYLVRLLFGKPFAHEKNAHRQVGVYAIVCRGRLLAPLRVPHADRALVVGVRPARRLSTPTASAARRATSAAAAAAAAAANKASDVADARGGGASNNSSGNSGSGSSRSSNSVTRNEGNSVGAVGAAPAQYATASTLLPPPPPMQQQQQRTRDRVSFVTHVYDTSPTAAAAAADASAHVAAAAATETAATAADVPYSELRSASVVAFDAFFVARTEQLLRIKEYAIATEDYETASECRNALRALHAHAQRVYELEQDKVQAMLADDFVRAQHVKAMLETLLETVYAQPSSSLQQPQSQPQLQQPPSLSSSPRQREAMMDDADDDDSACAPRGVGNSGSRSGSRSVDKDDDNEEGEGHAGDDGSSSAGSSSSSGGGAATARLQQARQLLQRRGDDGVPLSLVPSRSPSPPSLLLRPHPQQQQQQMQPSSSRPHSKNSLRASDADDNRSHHDMSDADDVAIVAAPPRLPTTTATACNSPVIATAATAAAAAAAAASASADDDVVMLLRARELSDVREQQLAYAILAMAGIRDAHDTTRAAVTAAAAVAPTTTAVAATSVGNTTTPTLARNVLQQLQQHLGRYATACLTSRNFRLREAALRIAAAQLQQHTTVAVAAGAAKATSSPAAAVIAEDGDTIASAAVAMTSAHAPDATATTTSTTAQMPLPALGTTAHDVADALLRYCDCNGYGLQDTIPSLVLASCALVRVILAERSPEHMSQQQHASSSPQQQQTSSSSSSLLHPVTLLVPLMALVPRLLTRAADAPRRVREAALQTLAAFVACTVTPASALLAAALADPVDVERRTRRSTSNVRVQLARLSLLQLLHTHGRLAVDRDVGAEAAVVDKLLLPSVNHPAHEVRDAAMSLLTQLLTAQKLTLREADVRRIRNTALRELVVAAATHN